MSHSVLVRARRAAVVGSVGIAFHLSPGVHAIAAPVFASIVPGSFTQGSVQSSLGTGTTYANPANNLGDWWTATNNPASAGTRFAISMANADFNNSYNGNATVVAFGNGGGLTLHFAAPVKALAGQKEFGIFTAQMLNAGTGAVFSGNMEAAILVSADNVNWFTLTGTPVTSPTSYTATSYRLNAPTLGYDFTTSAQAWAYGSPGTTAANLALLNVADYTSPMPDDNLFNGTGSDAQRLALKTDTSQADYDAIFGDTGGGNWFDISSSGLSEVNYLRLNGVNVGGGGLNGIRLDAVFANSAAVPEPGMAGLAASIALLLIGRTGGRRRRSGTAR